MVPGPEGRQSHEWWSLSSVLHLWEGVFPLSPQLLRNAPEAGDHTAALPGPSSAQKEQWMENGLTYRASTHFTIQKHKLRVRLMVTKQKD